jgi:hypothetical protein
MGGTLAWSAAGGFAAGAVQTGTLRGATTGAITAMAFAGVAKAFPVKGMDITTSEGLAAYSKLALASGITGGVLAQVQGGRFGNGFVSAGASAFLSPIPELATSNAGGQMVIMAVDRRYDVRGRRRQVRQWRHYQCVCVWSYDKRVWTRFERSMEL